VYFRIVLEKLMVIKLVKKYLYGIRRFIIMDLMLSLVNSVCTFTAPFFTINFNIILPDALRYPK
jgi:hypothetical protein